MDHSVINEWTCRSHHDQYKETSSRRLEKSFRPLFPIIGDVRVHLMPGSLVQHAGKCNSRSVQSRVMACSDKCYLYQS